MALARSTVAILAQAILDLCAAFCSSSSFVPLLIDGHGTACWSLRRGIAGGAVLGLRMPGCVPAKATALVVGIAEAPFALFLVLRMPGLRTSEGYRTHCWYC
jgi:hypothetical protein